MIWPFGLSLHPHSGARRPSPSEPRCMAGAVTATAESPPGAADAAVAPATNVPDIAMDGGEIVILAIKPSIWRAAFDSAGWIIASISAALLLALLNNPLSGRSWAAAAQLALVPGVARLGIAIVRWVPAWYLLTNRRLIDVRGVRAPRIRSFFLTDVGDTFVTRSTAESLVRVGTIGITDKHCEGTAIYWRSIPNTEDVHQRIRQAVRNARNFGNDC